MFIRVSELAPKWVHVHVFLHDSRTRAAENYEMAMGLGQAKVHISREFGWFLGGHFAAWLAGVGLVVGGELTSF